MEVEPVMMLEFGKVDEGYVARWWSYNQAARALLPGEWKACEEITLENGVVEFAKGGFRHVVGNGETTIKFKTK